MEHERLAIATVPVQPWGPLYDEEEALCQGTVFPQLNMPFYAAEDADFCRCHEARPLSETQARREELMKKINSLSFFLDDLSLFLDTHPQDLQGLALYKEKKVLRQSLLCDFAKEFYPLTKDSIWDCDKNENFCWQCGPMPWEGGCV